MDTVDQATRSRMMAGIKVKNTRPERTLRGFLHREGFRFRLHPNILSGKPDLILPKYKLSIFVHGCFWHRHPSCPKTTMPSTNPGKWSEKFAANVERDRRNIANLRDLGWRVFVLWECGVSASGGSELAWLSQAIVSKGLSYVEWPIQPHRAGG